MINSIIFDLDDTIVNSSPLHFEAYEKALKEFGLKSVEIPPNLRREIYGMRIKEIMELFAKHFKLDVNVKLLTKRRNEIFMELVQKGVTPMPGLNALIKNVKKWKMKRSIASSGVRSYVEEVLKQLKLSDFFQTVVTGDDVKNPKPDPEVFLKAAEKLNSNPLECVVIEDAMNGVIAAKAAGMKVITIKTDSDQDLSGADFIIENLGEITLEMINGNM